MSRSLRTVESRHDSIESADWSVARLAGRLDNEAIGESDRWMALKGRVRPPDRILMLQGHLVVFHKHADGDSDLAAAQSVDGLQHPDGLHEHQKRNPCSRPHERFGVMDLFRVVPDNQRDENTGVNGSRVCVSFEIRCRHPCP